MQEIIEHRRRLVNGFGLPVRTEGPADQSAEHPAGAPFVTA
jgi:hypothetical protein